MRSPDAVTAAEVREAVRALMPEHGRVESHTLAYPAARRLDVDMSAPAGHSGGYSTTTAKIRHQQAVRRFEGQVAAALNWLAAKGDLVKVGAGRELPGSSRTVPRNQAYWYTPEAYQKEKAENERLAREESARRDRLEAISARAGKLGIVILDPQRPDPRALEQLLVLAEASAPWSHPGHDVRKDVQDAMRRAWEEGGGASGG